MKRFTEDDVLTRAGTASTAPALSERDKLSIILGVLVAMLLAALDQTIVAPAMPTIGAALGDAAYLPWIITAYLLTATSATPLYGKISDIYGRRPVMNAGIVIFMAGSVISALAPDMLTLVVGRAVQGLGGGGLLVLAQTVIGDTVPPLERAKYAAYISGTWAIASVAGPLLGGFLTEHLHWSLIFWINIPIGVGALLAMQKPLGRLVIHGPTHRLDFLGGGLVLLATVPLMLALTWGGETLAWTSNAILGLFAVSLLFWILLAARLGTAEEPLIPLAVLRNPIVAAATIGMFFGMAVNVGVAVYLPLYLQGQLGLSIAESGAALLGLVTGTTVGAAITGWLVARMRHYKRLAVGGMLVACLSLAALGLVSSTHSLLLVELLLILIGCGIGTMFPIGTISVQNAVKHHHLGIGTAVLSFLRNLGASIGVAVLGTIALNSGLPAGAAVEGSSVSGLAETAAFGIAFRSVFLASAALMGIALLCFVVMKEKPLRSSFEDPEAAIAG